MVVGQPLTAGREAGAGGTRATGPLEGAGPSTVVGTRGIIEEVGGGEVGVEEGMGMEEMEVLLYINNNLSNNSGKLKKCTLIILTVFREQELLYY